VLSLFFIPPQKYTGECTCNASDILEAIKDNESLRETLRGAPGAAGKDGKPGTPGHTVSTDPTYFQGISLSIFIL